MNNPLREYFQMARAIRRAQREGRTDEFIRAAKENARIQKTMLRPMRYEAIDGAGEIACATMWLGFALSSYTYLLLPGTSLWTHVIAWLLFGGGAFGRTASTRPSRNTSPGRAPAMSPTSGTQNPSG